MESLGVTIAQATEQSPAELLTRILQVSGFWPALKSVRQATKKTADEFLIAIKPDLDLYDLAFPAGTDPELVAHLASLLRTHGYTRITVLDARNSDDAWLLNRDPLMVADLAGYDFSSDSYTIAGVGAAASWSDADFRINFARNRTHESHLYALCLHNLLGVSVTTDNPVDAAERCLQTLQTAPPHFNLVDAWVSCHGGAGERAPRMLRTCTLFAGVDTLLVDFAAACKMGLDPFASPLNARALRHQGLPDSYQIHGNTSPFPLWENVHPLVADSARKRNGIAILGNITQAWFQRVDREHFPIREFYNDRINSFIAPLMEKIGEDARSQYLLVVLNYALAYVGHAVLAQYTLFAKHKLARQTKTLETDLSQYPGSFYEGLTEYLAPFERLLTDIAPNEHGIRLRRIDDTMLFAAAQDIPIAYGDFVRRVKIEQAVAYMNDYIGGSVVSVKRDRRNRVRHRAERNLYLQQPNWMVLLGGDVIDVEKLELIRYRPNERTIYWRTVASPNESAESDDGRVTFSRTESGQTRVEIFTRQKFALPTFFKLVNIDLLPGVRDPIVAQAYRTYFEGTMANLLAGYEGQDYRAGRDPASLENLTGNGVRDLARYSATALATLAELLRYRADYAGLDQWFANRTWTQSATTTPVLDEDGFRHFGPSPPGTRYDRRGPATGDYFKQLEEIMLDSPGFLSGLAAAVQSDFEQFAASASEPAHADEGGGA